MYCAAVEENEPLYIGNDIVVRVVSRKGRKTELGIEAPLSLKIEHGGDRQQKCIVRDPYVER